MSQEEIKAEAKRIMDSFMTSMKDIEVEDEFIQRRDINVREESLEVKGDENFRECFLDNAPNRTQDGVLANRGEWTK